MSDKQNLIFFLALTLMIISFTVSGRTKLLWDGVFNTSTQHGGTIGNPPVHVKPNKHGKCPFGYNKQSDGSCILHSHLPI